MITPRNFTTVYTISQNDSKIELFRDNHLLISLPRKAFIEKALGDDEEKSMTDFMSKAAIVLISNPLFTDIKKIPHEKVVLNEMTQWGE